MYLRIKVIMNTYFRKNKETGFCHKFEWNTYLLFFLIFLILDQSKH